jgi:uncharacterized protein (DUF1810 family)
MEEVDKTVLHTAIKAIETVAHHQMSMVEETETTSPLQEEDSPQVLDFKFLTNKDSSEEEEEENYGNYKKENERENIHDPHNLRRYTSEQKYCFSRALREIKNGEKQSCWMWYVLPTAPWIVNGIERGSWTNQRYALRGDDAAVAYLNFKHDGVDLGKNYKDIITAIAEQLEAGVDPVDLMGFLDAPKLVSNVELFERISRTKQVDKELNDVCARALKILQVKNKKKKRSYFDSDSD